MDKRLVCTTKEGLKIYEVNGREARDLYTEFALTCSDKRCKFVPENEIWVEKLVDIDDMCFNLKRELAMRMITELGVNPRKATSIAAAIEKKERKSRSCDLQDMCSGEFSSAAIKEHMLEMLPFILEETDALS